MLIFKRKAKCTWSSNLIQYSRPTIYKPLIQKFSSSKSDDEKEATAEKRGPSTLYERIDPYLRLARVQR